MALASIPCINSKFRLPKASAPAPLNYQKNRQAVPGAIVSVQTFGSLLDFHPHLPLLVTWGVFEADGAFVPVADVPEVEEIQKLFRHTVFRMLLDQGVIDADRVRTLLAWPPTGFGAHVGEVVFPDVQGADQPKGVKGLPEYPVRAPVTLTRMRLAQGDRGIYPADRHHPGHEADFRIFTSLEFLAALVAHLPVPHTKSVIYSGWYSNKQRGLRKNGALLSLRAAHHRECSDEGRSRARRPMNPKYQAEGEPNRDREIFLQAATGPPIWVDQRSLAKLPQGEWF